MYWEGRSLVLDMKMETKNGGSASNLVKYSLADDGNTLIALELRERWSLQREPSCNSATSVGAVILRHTPSSY